MGFFPLRIASFLSLLAAGFFSFILFPGSSRAEDRHTLQCVIHLHSDWSYLSEGNTLEQLAQWGESSGADAVFVTDHALVRATYALFPFWRSLAYSVQKRSVFQGGIEKYLSEVRSLQKQHPSILFLPAVEVSPFYYWSGIPLTGTFTLHDWHRHLLVLGIKDPKILKGLPIVSSPHFHPFTFLPGRLGYLLPCTGFLFLLFAFRKKRTPFFRWVRIGMIFLVLLLLIEAIPFGDPFDPFHGEQGAAPYQRLIDYVRSHRGLIFWAHPEVESASDVVLGGVRLVTEPYGELLAKTENYTGFAALGRGKGLITPGGPWDQWLRDYCEGRRSAPVWVMSEMDTLGAPELFRLKETGVWAKERSEEALFEALRKGRMVAAWNTRGRNEAVSLEAFTVRNESGEEAGMGEETTSQGSVQIRWRFRVGRPDYHPNGVLIRQGRVLRTFLVSDGEEILVEDSLKDGISQKIYYRLLLEEPPLATNPIFVSVIQEDFPLGR